MNANLPRHAGGTAADPESAPTAHPPAVGEVPGSAAQPVLDTDWLREPEWQRRGRDGLTCIQRGPTA